MTLRFAIAVTILAAIVPFTGVARAADVTEGHVTFQRDVLPILAKHCQNCHRPGQVAPMSFLTYETTRPWARQIKAVVTVKKMPPVVGSPHYMVLTRGEGLTQAEIATLVKWVDEGAPQGTASGVKPAPGKGSKK
jgi:mono/diheme cytochrome c family protein